MDRHRIILYHTSGNTAPNTDDILVGEISVVHNNTQPSLYIKKNNGELSQFVDKKYIDDKVDNIDLSNLVTDEEFEPVKSAALNSITKGTLGTINGESIESGNVSIDLSLYKIVTTLPTEDILDNKIYFVPNYQSTAEKNIFDEYVYHKTGEGGYWEMLGQYKPEIDLTGYLTKTDADKKYVAKSENQNAAINTDKNGAMANFSDNGQAYLAVRPKTTDFLINTPYAGASFGVKNDGTSAFSHKTYTSYNKEDGSYKGARNTAVLQFAGPIGLRYAKNTSTSSDVSEDMYRYVGVIDSQDEFQRVYSAKQVDDLLKEKQDIIDKLIAAIRELGGTIDE